MNISARKTYFRQAYQKRQAQAEDGRRKTEEQKRLEILRSAAKVCDIQGIKRQTLDVIDLSYAQQCTILEKYAERLSAEIQAFSSRWGVPGKGGVLWFVTERSEVLNELARTKIRWLKDEYEPKRRNYEQF